VAAACKVRGKEYSETYFGTLAGCLMAALAFFFGSILYGLSVPTIGASLTSPLPPPLPAAISHFGRFVLCMVWYGLGTDSTQKLGFSLGLYVLSGCFATFAGWLSF
jgi:hypothetical protein